VYGDYGRIQKKGNCRRPKMKKVLVITYYWPPSGGGGVQRWLKFTRYLPEFGWHPIVYTPANPQFENRDETLLKDVGTNITVIKQSIKEPYKLFNKLFFLKKRSFKQGVVSERKGGSIFEFAVSWIRGNLFLPDPRVSWVRPSIKFLSDFIQKENISLIVTTGPPHSMHLIGLKLKSLHEVKWIADFRDPWSDWDILDLLHLNKRSRKVHEKMEEKVVRNADAVITVSNSWASILKERYQVGIEVITNGYDAEDFEGFSKVHVNEFRMLHAGLLNSYRNCSGLWQVLEDILKEDNRFAELFQLVLAGNVTEEVTSQIGRFDLLAERTIVLGYIRHDELISEYSKASSLLLLQNDTKNSNGHIPAKVFEYLATNIPILALGNQESDLGKIMNEYNVFPIHEVDNAIAQKESILKMFRSFMNGEELPQAKSTSSFQRRNLTKSLAELLDSLGKPAKI
jgi:glycosyltransferase involved in cell wall biosynthesis